MGIAVTMLLAASLAACASAPRQPPLARRAPPPASELYVYPARGQSLAQQQRDRYDCHVWAANQTGFDPSAMQSRRPPTVRVDPDPPPGHDTTALAVTGAVVGAVVASPGHGAQGAVLGAVAGAAAGAASDASRQASARRMEDAYARRDAEAAALPSVAARSYRRAIGACLEGRGYSLR